MRKLLGGLPVIVVALLVAATSASAATRVMPACSLCGYVSAHGTGTITESSSSGLGYAAVTNGSIAIRGAHVHVAGGKGHWNAKLKARVYSSKSLSFRATGSFWVRITGHVTNFGSNAHGNVTLKGSGVYTLNNGPQRHWSETYRTLAIRW
jgi:hypothetical protein